MRKRLVAAADETISEYRNSDAPTVFEPQWLQARNNLARALELDPGNSGIEGRLRLCEGAYRSHRGERFDGAARQKRLNAAVNKFEEAAELLKHSPDPYLGLASLYMYDLSDVEKAEEALNKAAHYGHPTGKRETAQLGGWLSPACRSNLAPIAQLRRRSPAQERDYLDQSQRGLYPRARNCIGGWIVRRCGTKQLQAMQGEQRVEQRLNQLEKALVSQ